MSHSLCVSSQSWWVWSDTEIRDLWFNCFHDNATKTWLCTTSNESGQCPAYSLVHSDLCPFTTQCDWIFYTGLILDVVPWPPSLQDWLQSVQALMVLSVVFSSISFLVFLGQLITMSKGGLFYFTGLCQAFAGLENSSISYLAAHTSLTFWRRVATIWFLETWKLALFGFTVDEMPCCALKMDVVFAIRTFPCCTILQKWLIVHLINIRYAKYCNKTAKKKKSYFQICI